MSPYRENVLACLHELTGHVLGPMLWHKLIFRARASLLAAWTALARPTRLFIVTIVLSGSSLISCQLWAPWAGRHAIGVGGGDSLDRELLEAVTRATSTIAEDMTNVN